MPWARLDDQFPIHRKVGALSDASFRLHVEAICWCVRNLTDGAVSRDDLPQVTRIKKAERYAAELVRRGVWRETVDGWKIHDFLDYQPSKNQVQQDRASNADRQRRWRDQHKRNGHAVTHAVTSTVTNSAPTRPDPLLGGAVGDSLTSRGREPPPPRCPQHLDEPSNDPCGRCADARRARDRWDAAAAARERAQPRCRQHRGQPAHNCALCRSEALADQEAP